MSSPAMSFRPTRRDLLLVLLTLTTSYLFFSPRSDVQLAPIQAVDPIHSVDTDNPSSPSTSTTKGGKYLPDWLWSTEHHTPAPAAAPCRPETTIQVREETFGESVQTYGTSHFASFHEHGGDRVEGWIEGAEAWDQGNEEFEAVDPPAILPAGGISASLIKGTEGELNDIKTELLGHQPGWTLVDRLYIFNGSFYVVTEEWPDLIHMISTGLPANNDPGNAELRKPKGHEIIFITPEEAATLWGSRVLRMGGTTWLFNDGQFIDHYYHFSAELLLGAWRAYASLDQNITPQGETSLPPPRRAWFLHQDVSAWRDKPMFNPTVLFAAFPSISLLYPQDWADMRNLTNTSRPRAYMLERALLADRSAAFYGDYTAPTSRTVASALWVGTTSVWWWEPIRRQILRVAGLPDAVLDRNLEGWGAIDPVHFDEDAQPAHAHPIGKKPLSGDMDAAQTGGLQVAANYKPVVTYISRQASRRRLPPESHESLVTALEESRDRLGFELNVVLAEKLSREDQIALAGKTTIMLGVHGNGLTHLLWMPATPRSAVIELYFRGGFARDYQWTAHCLGMRHFGVNHDISFTAPVLPEVEYPEGFHGTEITVDGQFVAGLVEDRLAGRI